MSNKIICIGDVHGEIHKLRNLFEKLSFVKNDTIVFLGDYIDRGEDSKAVIDFVLSLQDKCNLVTLKGNHEMFALDGFAYCEGKLGLTQMFNSWMRNGGVKCLRSYSTQCVEEQNFAGAVNKMVEQHGDFFNRLQLTYETDNHIFVHGHLAHEQDVEDQTEWQCTWGRYDDIWQHKSGKTVVCGHTIQYDGVKNDGFKICIDTGSFLPDGYITAMIIDGQKETFIDSK